MRILLLSLLALPSLLYAQIAQQRKQVLSKTWTDEKGRNTLSVWIQAPAPRTGDEADTLPRSAVLTASHKVVINTGKELELWVWTDSVRDCALDLWIGLLPNSTTVTDLDKDGISETTLVYRKVCRGDISPSEMKVVMHEGRTAMVLHGYMAAPAIQKLDSLRFDPDFTTVKLDGLREGARLREHFGRFDNHNDFNGKPYEFLRHARNAWIKQMFKDQFTSFE
ncbi:MAG: hypothetical protein K1X47_05250 [Cyclobacteriaceae bacterium]|nr:hypothetical protein [Cyclobacteriaceae bacterium]